MVRVAHGSTLKVWVDGAVGNGMERMSRRKMGGVVWWVRGEVGKDRDAWYRRQYRKRLFELSTKPVMSACTRYSSLTTQSSAEQSHRKKRELTRKVSGRSFRSSTKLSPPSKSVAASAVIQ